MAKVGIKGSVKLTLHNVHNGKNEIITGKNIITSAVSDLFGCNFMNLLDYSKFTPLHSNYFGGVLAYKNPHPLVNGDLDPDDYYAYNNDTNPLTAHAGDEAPASAVIAAEDYQRGSPAQLIIADGTVKRVWEWTPSQGNGIIAALSLTHKDTGNVGLGNGSSSFKAFSPFLVVSGSQLSSIIPSLTGEKNVFARYDDHHALAFYIGDDGDYGAGNTKFQTNKVSVYVKLLGVKKYGLFDSVEPTNTNVRKFTVTTSITFYMQPAYYFDETNKRLWLFTNNTSISTWSKTNINYTVIDCVNGTEYAHGTIVSDTSNIAPCSQDRTVGNTYNEPVFPNIVKNGNYFYFPTTDQNDWNYNSLTANAYSGFKKINITDTADQEQIDYAEPAYRFQGGMASGGLTLIDGAVINGDTAYNCAYAFPNGEKSMLMNSPNRMASYVMPMGVAQTSINRYILANKMVNTSKFNLPNAVQKTTSQSMIIEYTLQEVSV